jgi:hypothetical protein
MWPDALLWLAVWLPFLVVAAVRSRIHWFPIQDQAVLDMRVRGLLHGRDVPLVGAFSRFGWSHPGPIWFYVLAPFRAFGGTDGLLAGSIALFGAGIATLPMLVRRRYGASAAAVSVLMCVPALAAAGAFTILVPWNPNLAFAWLPVFLLLALSSVHRRGSDLGPAVLVGAMLVQLHVGYLALVVCTLVLVMVLVWRRSGTPELRARVVHGRWWLIATALLYVPPLIEQLQHGTRGNLGKLAKFFIAPSRKLGGPAGLRFAAATLGGVLRWPLAGLGGHGEPIDFAGNLIPQRPWMVLSLFAIIAIVYVIARRIHNEELTDALIVVAVVLAVSFASLSRVIGERWPYLFTWRFAVVWFIIGVVVVAAGRMLNRRTNFGNSPWAWVALVVAVVTLGGAVISEAVATPYGQVLALERSTEKLADAVRASAPRSQPVLLLHVDGFVNGVADGLMNNLDDKGWHVGAEPALAYKYGQSHAVDTKSARQVWYVTETSTGTTLTTSVPGARVLALETPLTTAEEHELARLQRQLIARMRKTNHLELLPAVQYELAGLATASRMDTSGIDMNRLDELNAKVARSGRCRCAVVVEPADIPNDELGLVGLVAPQ